MKKYFFWYRKSYFFDQDLSVSLSIAENIYWTYMENRFVPYLKWIKNFLWFSAEPLLKETGLWSPVLPDDH